MYFLSIYQILLILIISHNIKLYPRHLNLILFIYKSFYNLLEDIHCFRVTISRTIFRLSGLFICTGIIKCQFCILCLFLAMWIMFHSKATLDLMWSSSVSHTVLKGTSVPYCACVHISSSELFQELHHCIPQI